MTGALEDTSVELRLDGRDVRVSVTRHVQESATNGSASAGWAGPTRDAGAAEGGQSADDLRRAMQDAGGELSRTTVRLFNELKSQAERAAAQEGVSLNTYISRAVSDSVRSAVPGKGNRGHGPGGRTVTGYVRG